MSYPRQGGEREWGIALFCGRRPHERTNAERPEGPSVNFCEEHRRARSGLQAPAGGGEAVRHG